MSLLRPKKQHHNDSINIHKEYPFDVTATDACKGVALLFLLWHHLFNPYPEYGFYIFLTSQLAKVCVSIFLILSGYGLSESIKNKKIGLFAFYRKHLTKLYLNYWFIAALFVPIGILFMNYPLESAYNDHAYLKFLVQMTGLHRWIYPELGYNATWWYMSTIIPLYLLFPLIYLLTKKGGIWFFSLILIIMFLFPIDTLTGNVIMHFLLWSIPFCFGVYISHINGFVVINSLLNRTSILRFVILILLIMGVALQRQYGVFINSLKIDWLLGSLIILLTFELSNLSYIIRIILSFLGNQLFNIFLFHSFIFYYYWHDKVYYFKDPFLIFTVFLSVCLLVSIFIEQIKKLILFYKLEASIINISIHDKYFI
jgi:hypothetical protein